MTAIDRVMRAYLTTRDLTEEQIAAVRHELLQFIAGFIISESRRSIPTRLQESVPCARHPSAYTPRLRRKRSIHTESRCAPRSPAVQ